MDGEEEKSGKVWGGPTSERGSTHQRAGESGEAGEGRGWGGGHSDKESVGASLAVLLLSPLLQQTLLLSLTSLLPTTPFTLV